MLEARARARALILRTHYVKLIIFSGQHFLFLKMTGPEFLKNETDMQQGRC